MTKKLVSRPNLDHLRTQAKTLLQDLRRGNAEALATIQSHHPRANKMSVDEIGNHDWRLADAQLVIAKQTGFASWPKLSLHVETLRGLEGTWHFESLEVAGSTMAPGMLEGSRILIDGDRFLSESAGTVYEGTFVIDVEPKIPTIDIHFVAGPEAGNVNFGIFRLDGSKLEICLETMANTRPIRFATKKGSGQAYERLVRHNASRPADVTGGNNQPRTNEQSALQPTDFEYVPGPTMRSIQGEWSAIKIVSDGKSLPSAMLKGAKRVANENRITVSVGGQKMIDALFRIDESQSPVAVDYFYDAGGANGRIQFGLLQLTGDELTVIMAPPGRPRPTTFESRPGSQETLSVWKLDD